MTSTSTTTTAGKVAKPRKSQVPPAKRAKKPYTRLQLVQEVEALYGQRKDGGYLADLASGVRTNTTLGPIVARAVKNLTARTK